MHDGMTHRGDEEGNFKIDYRDVKNAAQTAKRPNRPTIGRRRRKSPALVNGIHRRRQKRVAW